MGTTIPFGKAPYNPRTITGQLPHSRFETFQGLLVLLAIILKDIRSWADQCSHTKSSALAAASNPQEDKALRHSRGFMSETAIGVSGDERRDVRACPSCYTVIHTLANKEARSVLDLLADLWLALQRCGLFGEQHSSFLCCYFKAGFLLPSITEAVGKLRSFQGLSLHVRAQRDPASKARYVLCSAGGKSKVNISCLSLSNFNPFNFQATENFAYDRDDNSFPIQRGNGFLRAPSKICVPGACIPAGCNIPLQGCSCKSAWSCK